MSADTERLIAQAFERRYSRWERLTGSDGSPSMVERDATPEVHALASALEVAETLVRERLDLGYAIKDDLLDALARAEAAETRLAQVEVERDLYDARCCEAETQRATLAEALVAIQSVDDVELGIGAALVAIHGIARAALAAVTPAEEPAP